MDEDKSVCKSLRSAILAAQRSAGTVHKGRTAEVRKKDGTFAYEYAFAGGEDIVAHGLAVLHQHDVSWEIESFRPAQAPGGVYLELVVGLFHAGSGEHATRSYLMPVAGFGDGDKVYAGTITYCKGYAMAALLGIVRTDKRAQRPDERTTHVADDVEVARGRLTSAAKRYKKKCEEQEIEQAGWIDVASAAIGEPWKIDAHHTADEYRKATAEFLRITEDLMVGP